MRSPEQNVFSGSLPALVGLLFGLLGLVSLEAAEIAPPLFSEVVGTYGEWSGGREPLLGPVPEGAIFSDQQSGRPPGYVWRNTRSAAVTVVLKTTHTKFHNWNAVKTLPETVAFLTQDGAAETAIADPAARYNPQRMAATWNEGPNPASAQLLHTVQGTPGQPGYEEHWRVLMRNPGPGVEPIGYDRVVRVEEWVLSPDDWIWLAHLEGWTDDSSLVDWKTEDRNLLSVVEAPLPTELLLIGTAFPATATLNASEASVMLGQSVSFSLSHTLSASFGRRLNGPGLPGGAVLEPATNVAVSPVSIGSQQYTYTVPGGFVQLAWNSNSPAGRFILNLPDGTRVDVTGRASYNVTQTGLFTITQTNLAGSATSPALPVTQPLPAVATAEVMVLPRSGAISLVLSLVESSQRVMTLGSSYYGRSFKRAWKVGEDWQAYLGRGGIRFVGEGESFAGAGLAQLEAKNPEEGSEWVLLSEVQASPFEGGRRFTCAFEVALGSVVPGQPLVPESWARGRALTGLWKFRARVCDLAGVWSAWSSELPVQVVLPLVTRSETLQALPPAGENGDWFVASEPKSFSLSLWVP